MLQQLVQLQFGLQYTPDAKHSQYLPCDGPPRRQYRQWDSIHGGNFDFRRIFSNGHITYTHSFRQREFLQLHCLFLRFPSI